MNINLEKYGIDPQSFLDAINREYSSTNRIPVESKEPLALLAALVAQTYKIAPTKANHQLEQNFGDLEDFIAQSDTLIKTNLRVAIDNPIADILLTAIFYKAHPRHDGVPTNIYCCIQDALTFKLREQRPFFDDIPAEIPVDPEFKRLASAILDEEYPLAHCTHGQNQRKHMLSQTNVGVFKPKWLRKQEEGVVAKYTRPASPS